ncbi:MAG TPA: CHAD domain-containing protein, partial [Candidatus Limnocylindrales bacterium]|nr:CHAD domain-containing protein [Candidatus Limnocylindrales bacterium]
GLETLLPVARELQRAGAVPAPPVPKAVRALGARATAAPDIVPVAPQPGSTAGDVVRAAIADGLLRLVRNDAAARLRDDEAIHQMRVATRRLRSDLRTFDELLDPEWSAGLASELRWLGDLLGPVRDRDVELAFLDEMAADLRPDIDPLREDLEARREAARADLLAALADPRYLDLLDRLVEAARAPMLTGRHGRPARRALPQLARAAAVRLRRRAAKVSPDADESAYHRVRIAAKRARYASEAVAPFIGRDGRAHSRAARRATAVQGILGRLQDAAVLENDTRDLLRAREGDARFAFAAGQLVGRLEGVMHEVRTAFPAARKRLAGAAAALQKR